MNADRTTIDKTETRQDSFLVLSLFSVRSVFISSIRFIRVPFLALLATPLLAQPKAKDAKPAPPKIVCPLTVGIDPGKTTKVIVRGVNLDGVAEVRVHEPKSSAKVVGKPRKVGVPNQTPPELVGDGEIDIEFTLPAEAAGGAVEFSLVGPGGESKPGRVLVNGDVPRIAEKEPNDSLKAAQAVAVPQVVDASFNRPQDVDVFQFDGKAGETIVVEAQANRIGAPTDVYLTLYDADGRTLATAAPGGTDATLEAKLPKDGAYLLSAIEANDQGGAALRLPAGVPQGEESDPRLKSWATARLLLRCRRLGPTSRSDMAGGRRHRPGNRAVAHDFTPGAATRGTRRCRCDPRERSSCGRRRDSSREGRCATTRRTIRETFVRYSDFPARASGHSWLRDRHRTSRRTNPHTTARR